MRKLNIFRRIAFVAGLGLLLLLGIAQAIPLTFSEADILAQASFQGARSQRITKNALALAYRPDGERAQSVSELQLTLPAWEAEQARLQKLRNADLHTLVVQSQPDFVSIDTAANKILVHPKDRADLVQVSIIVEHERNYSILMLQVATLLQQQIQDFNARLVITQNVLVVLAMALLIIKFALAEKTLAQWATKEKINE